MCGKKSGKIKRALGLILFSVMWSQKPPMRRLKKYPSNKTDSSTGLEIHSFDLQGPRALQIHVFFWKKTVYHKTHHLDCQK